MPIPLLDAGGVLLPIIYIGGFMIIAVVLEAIVLLLFKVNTFGRLFFQSLLVNVISLVIGFLLLRLPFAFMQEGEKTEVSILVKLGIFFAITLAVETWLLYRMNRDVPRSRIWPAALLMNVLSYTLIYLLIR